VPEYAAEHKLGMEEAARTLRYRELNRLCTEQGADLLAVAHNATDQLETVLMHLARGSGLDGLCGMRKKSSGLIRPLLSLSKKEILAWCNENEIPYMEDSSNSDQTYTRNFVRQTILPAIHRLNPRAEDAAAVAAAALDLDRDCLDRLAAEHRLSDGRASLCALHDAILLRIIRREFQEGFRDAPMLTSLQCRAAMEAIRGGKSPIRVTLPGSGELFCDRNEVVIRKKKGDPVFPSFDPLLLKEGWQSFDNENGMILLRRGILSEYDRENIAFFQNIYNFANTMSFNSAKINGDIYLRARKASDSYFDGFHTRDVRKLLQSTHLPLAVRARYPIACDEHGILWIPGFPARGDTSDEVEDPIQIFCFFEKKNRSCP
jgi:tRNA(Ile)-lysidine synthase